MIRRLRTRHRWMILIVTVLTALLFGIALAGRQSPRSLAGQHGSPHTEPVK